MFNSLHPETMFSPQGILKFYNFPIPSPPAASSNHHPSSLPEGVQFVLNTLPVRCDQLFQNNSLITNITFSTVFYISIDEWRFSHITNVIRLITSALEMVMALLLMFPQRIRGNLPMCHWKCMRWWLQGLKLAIVGITIVPMLFCVALTKLDTSIKTEPLQVSSL